MEAVPRLPMISCDLKVSPSNTEFGPILKKYIRDHYHEDPESYNKEIKELETLRQNAIKAPMDFTGCSLLKRYYSQLHKLQSRFPMTDDGAACVPFMWTDIYSGVAYNITDIEYEEACILYNIGALHSKLGTLDSRCNAEGMKIACAHFQCAAWAFQHLRDTYPQPKGSDMSHDLLTFFINTMLAQAQECILEKSMLDSRKSSITAKIAAQIVEYYKCALGIMVSGSPSTDAGSILDIVGSKTFKNWKKFIEFKMSYYMSIAHLYMGNQAEENEKWGERVAWFQSAYEHLTESFKLAKSLDKDELNDSLVFTMDVIGGKHNSAKKENDFVYHEKVPVLSSLPELKGASLVKGIPFNINDPEVSGPDIFARLVPMEAHETSSLYSEEKAKILRSVVSKIEGKNEELMAYLSTLQLDNGISFEDEEKIPQELLEKCAAMSVQPNLIPDLKELMTELLSISTEVDTVLKSAFGLLSEEEQKEQKHQETFGKRGPSMIIVELKTECLKYEEAHKKAIESNNTLHTAVNLHINNLNKLCEPLEELCKSLPSISSVKSPENVKVSEKFNSLINKVEEMRKQREYLEQQLRDSLIKDDITRRLVTMDKKEDLQQTFAEELKKHSEILTYIDQNLTAQDNILCALTEANAQYADTRKVITEIRHKRSEMVKSLINSYDACDDLISKAKKGIEFYKKLQSNASRLLTRIKSVTKVQEEERIQRMEAELRKGSRISGMAPVPSEQHVPKLKDYLPYMSKRGPTAPVPSVPFSSQNLPYPSSIPSQFVSEPVRQATLGGPATTEIDQNIKSVPREFPRTGEIHNSSFIGARPAPVGSEQTPITAVCSASVNSTTGAYSPYSSNQQWPQTVSSTTVPSGLYDPYNYSPYASIPLTSNVSVNSAHVSAYPTAVFGKSSSVNVSFNASVPSVNNYMFSPLSSSISSSNSFPQAVASIPSFGVPPQVALPTSSLPYVSNNASQYTVPSSIVSSSAAFGVNIASNTRFSHPTSNSVISDGDRSGSESSVAGMKSPVGPTVVGPGPTQPAGSSMSGMKSLDTDYLHSYGTNSSAKIPFSASTPLPVPGSNVTQYIPSAIGPATTMVSSHNLHPASNSFNTGVPGSVTSSYLNATTNTTVSVNVPTMSSVLPSPRSIPQTVSQSQVQTVWQNSSQTNQYMVPSAGYPSAVSSYSSNLNAFPYSSVQSMYQLPGNVTATQATTTIDTRTNSLNQYPVANPNMMPYNQQAGIAYAASAIDNKTMTIPSNFTYPTAQSLSGPTFQTNSSMPASGGIMSFASFQPCDNKMPINYASYPAGANVAQLSPTVNNMSLQPNASGNISAQNFSQPFYSQPANVQPSANVYGSSQNFLPLTSMIDPSVDGTNTAVPQPCDVLIPKPAVSNQLPPKNTTPENVPPSNSTAKKDECSNPSPVESQTQMAKNIITSSNNDVQETEIKESSSASESPLKVIDLKSITNLKEKETSHVKDPLDDSSVRSKFVSEVEKYEKLVDGLVRKSLNGTTPLDQKWKEFIEAQDKEARKLSISVARCYPLKNRFPDVMPYDSNRVKLTCSKDDYINASYLKDICPSSPVFVITQAPLPATFNDFWLMVWEQQVETLICLLSDTELKNHVYFPKERGQTLTFGMYEISLHNHKEKSGFTERMINITHVKNRTSKVVIHLQFTLWPVSGVPSSPASLLQFISDVLSYQKQQRNLLRPVVVHCSAGIGRSGCFCLITALVSEMNNGHGPRDVAQVAATVSQQRKFLIQDKDQLKFCYDTVLYYAQDLLMKRGILTTRASFEGKLPNTGGSSSHVRHPSEDFILGGGLSKLQSGIAKIGFSGDQSASDTVVSSEKSESEAPSDRKEEDFNKNEADVSDSSQQQTKPNGTETSTAESEKDKKTVADKNLPSITSLLDPSNFTLDAANSPAKRKITKENFANSKGSLSTSSSDSSDPLSQLDPLWSLKK